MVIDAVQVKTPVILQMDNAECGSVALAIILAYFGRYVPPSEVREICDVSRDGSKAINLIKAARQYGLEAHGMQLNMENIRLLPPPFIIYWQFNHFLVVEGFGKDQVYLNDPATGPRSVTIQEFAQSFTGVALFLRPGAEFQRGGYPEPSILKLLWRQLSGERRRFFYMSVVAIAAVIPMIGLAFFAKVFLDKILLGGQTDWLPGLLRCMLITALLMAGLVWIKRYFLQRLTVKLKLTNVPALVWRLLNLPLKFFQQRATGDLAERVEADYRLSERLPDQTSQWIIGSFMMMIILLMILLLSWPLAIINLIAAVVMGGLFLMNARRRADLSRGLVQTDGKLSAIEMNGVQIIETLKSSVVENQFFNYWAAVHTQKLMHQQRIMSSETWLKVMTILFQGINIVLILGLGTWLIIQNQLSAGGLIAVQILVIAFTRLLMEALEASEYCVKLTGEISRITDINRHAPENILSSTPGEIHLSQPTAQPILELRNIEFGYSKLEPPIFVNISLRINAGERVAIVGPTGGGKSSMAKLICGLYPAWAGEILVQGIPLKQISRAGLARFIGLVDQQIFLFAATIRDNLTLWNSEVADDDVYKALQLAKIDDVVNERGGLDCWVEELGKNFSGGQVQRLEIARALLANPHLLILDEATSALDPLVEEQIYQNLRRQNRSLLIISHRLSTIRDCDQIIVINEGKIVQQGRHDSLIQSSGLYQELVSLEIQ